MAAEQSTPGLEPLLARGDVGKTHHGTFGDRVGTSSLQRYG